MKIRMKNNAYAVVSDNWIVLDAPYEAADCEYATYCVVREREDLPIFAFFSPVPFKDLPDEILDQIHKEICDRCPDYEEYLFYHTPAYKKMLGGRVWWNLWLYDYIPDVSFCSFMDLRDETAGFNIIADVNGEPGLICSENGPHIELLKQADNRE